MPCYFSRACRHTYRCIYLHRHVQPDIHIHTCLLTYTHTFINIIRMSWYVSTIVSPPLTSADPVTSPPTQLSIRRPQNASADPLPSTQAPPVRWRKCTPSLGCGLWLGLWSVAVARAWTVLRVGTCTRVRVGAYINTYTYTNTHSP